MGRLQHFRREFFESLGERLREYGFKPCIARQRFERPIAIGKQIAHIAFIRRPDDFDLTVDVEVRHDEIERLVFEPETELSEKEKLETATLGAELGNIQRIGQRRWTIVWSSDISAVVEGVYGALREIGLPPLDCFQSTEDISELCERDDAEANLWVPFDSYRAMRAIAAAYVLRDRGRFECLLEYKTQVMSDMGRDFELDQVRSFADHLMCRWDSRVADEKEVR